MLFGKKNDKIVKEYEKAAQQYKEMLAEQLYFEYRSLLACFSAIVKREGDLWAYDRELEEVDVAKFDVHRDEENKALVFSYKED